MDDCIIPDRFARLTPAELKAGHAANMISAPSGYLAGWVHPDGTIISVEHHSQAGDYSELYALGYARMVVEIKWSDHIGFCVTGALTDAQARTFIGLAVEFYSKGGYATVYGDARQTWVESTSGHAGTRSELISLIRAAQHRTLKSNTNA